MPEFQKAPSSIAKTATTSKKPAKAPILPPTPPVIDLEIPELNFDDEEFYASQHPAGGEEMNWEGAEEDSPGENGETASDSGNESQVRKI